MARRTDRLRIAERREAEDTMRSLLAEHRSGSDTVTERLEGLVRQAYAQADESETQKDAAHWARIARMYQSARDSIWYGE